MADVCTREANEISSLPGVQDAAAARMGDLNNIRSVAVRATRKQAAIW